MGGYSTEGFADFALGAWYSVNRKQRNIKTRWREMTIVSAMACLLAGSPRWRVGLTNPFGSPAIFDWLHSLKIALCSDTPCPRASLRGLRGAAKRDNLAYAVRTDFRLTIVISLPDGLCVTVSKKVRMSNRPRPQPIMMFSMSVGSGSLLGSYPLP